MSALAQTEQSAQTPTASQPLSSADLETLVARIALYPDDLVALIMSAALNPLQIVQADRYLDDVKKNPSLKPDKDWDGSVISLLNYPQIVSMMNDDLDWTQNIGEAVVNQQKDVLVAIQQLRDTAVARGIIKTNDQVVVEQKDDNVIIRPVKKEVVYVPQYDPVILTSPTYVAEPEPISYGPAYPSYYYPYAPYWAGFITGAVFGAAIDWNRWHSWSGNGDVDINNIRRDDFRFDRNNLNNVNFDNNKFGFDRNSISNNIQQNNANRLDRRGGNNIANNSGIIGSANGNRIQSSDIRRDVQKGLKAKSNSGIASNRPGKAANRNPGRNVAQTANRPNVGKGGQSARANRPQQRPAARVDNRPRQPSALGNYGPGRDTRLSSQRGRASREFSGGGRNFSGGGRGGGGRNFSGGGRGGGGRGGGGRGGGGRGGGRR
jgi:hypothetical protein